MTDWAVWVDIQRQDQAAPEPHAQEQTQQQQQFEERLKFVGVVRSKADFQKKWIDFLRIGDKSDSTFRLFREGVQPLWEDPANVGGGKLVWASMSAHEAQDTYRRLVEGIVDRRMPASPYSALTGVIVAKRDRRWVLSVWHRPVSHEAERLGELVDAINALLGKDIVWHRHSLNAPMKKPKRSANAQGARSARNELGAHSRSTTAGATSPPRNALAYAAALVAFFLVALVVRRFS